ncbi:hypothetical protein [Brevibacterium aurantiacum]|uniref:hypothetical protein n=1 Tax=Brevibacterium aurantiacum TaxID=273384 RepID=UPI0021B4145E|nr:hypothetical protein [Brevibacterium aurantiacum]
MSSTFPTATVIGYPHIGPNREQTKALANYWAGRIDAEGFSQCMRSLRLNTYSRLRELGLDEDYSIPASYSHCDHVLDTALSVGLIESQPTGTDFDLDEYFAAARATGQRTLLGVDGWFDANYRHLVPELKDSTPFRARPQHLLSLVSEARGAGHTIRPVLVGPVTLLALSKTSPDTNISAFDRLDELTVAYLDVISILAAAGVDWVQLDEPALVTDFDEHSDSELAEAASRAYTALNRSNTRPQIFVTAPHGSLRAGLSALAHSGIDALGVDVSAATRASDPDYACRIAAETPTSVHLVAGIIDGCTAMADNLSTSLSVLQDCDRESLSVSTSTSVVDTPHAVSAETDLNVHEASPPSAAEEKVTAVKTLAIAWTDRPDDTRRSSPRVGRPHGPLREIGDPQQLVASDTVFRLDSQTVPDRLHKAGDDITVGSAQDLALVNRSGEASSEKAFVLRQHGGYVSARLARRRHL